MSTYKCKMCGGDLSFAEGISVCECEYCGTRQTVPSDSGEKKAALFNRANRLRMNAEFDKAAAVYENIVAEFPQEAEAYWGLCLCAYGIEYVDDPATGEKKPTCHRTLPTSIMEDSNFEQACDNADAIARRVYRDEAKAVDRIQKDILSIVGSEKPYDVFICYKETAEEGGRTEDSVLAQDIYDELTGKGLKVFFARITLEDKLGRQYEPYIYAALSSAKVMLAVGTKFEYYDAVWVKNEWMRFLSMMKTDRSKTLIPCYKDLDAYDIPKEFRQLQAQDMGKLGWLQDLTRGVMKLCGKGDVPPATAAAPAAAAAGAANPTVDSLIKRVFIFLGQGDWENADQYCERVLDIEPENPSAYIGKMMAELRVRTPEDLAREQRPFSDNPRFQAACRYAEKHHEELPLIRTVRDAADRVRGNNALIAAIKSSDADRVRQLLEQGADPNFTLVENGSKASALCLAIRKDDPSPEIVKLLLASGADPNSRLVSKDGHSVSALMRSVSLYPDDVIAGLLIDAGADVTEADRPDGMTWPLLIRAIAKGNGAVVRRLLDKGADPNCEAVAKDGTRGSALMCCVVLHPDDEIADMLIDAGADVNYAERKEGSVIPVLISAISKDRVSIVRKLLEKGADPNCEAVFGSGDRRSALACCADAESGEEIAGLLTDAGADVDYIGIRDRGRFPVLATAALRRKTGLIRKLLEKGANPNCEAVYENGDRSSPLAICLEENNADETMQPLIDAGADVNFAVREEGESRPILILAIQQGNSDMVQKLLENGADPNCDCIMRDGTRSSALLLSITQYPNSRAASLLIDAGSDVNCVEKSPVYETPVLIYAIEKGNADLVRRLLEKGADPDAMRISMRSKNVRYSPLAESIAQWPNPQIARELVSHGARKCEYGGGSVLEHVMVSIRQTSGLPGERQFMDMCKFLDCLLDAGIRYEDEKDAVRKMKLPGKLPPELRDKMKKAGWKPSLF